MHKPQIYHFDGYQFDAVNYQLKKADRIIPLQPKQSELLKLLLEHQGQLVTRQEIQSTVWPDQIVDFDQSINFSIREIRRALEDDSKNPNYIQTLARRGYRFIFPITSINDEIKTSKDLSPQLSAVANKIAPTLFYMKSSALKIVAGLVIVLILGLFLRVSYTDKLPSEESLNESIATRNVLDTQTQSDLKRAIFLFDKANFRDYALSATIFEQLIQKYPEMATPYAYLSIAQLFTAMTVQQKNEAQVNLQRAVLYGGTLPETKMAEALFSLYLDWNVARAHGDLLEVVKQRPSWILARHELAVTAALKGERNLAAEQIARLLEINPGLAQERFHAGWFYLLEEDFHQALEQYRQSIEIDPTQPLSYLYAGYTARKMGLTLESVNYYQQFLGLFELDEARKQVIQNGLDHQNLVPMYDWWIDWLKQSNYPHFYIASAYAQMGNRDLALMELQQSLSQRESMFPTVPVFHEFLSLKNDPQFIVLSNAVTL